MADCYVYICISLFFFSLISKYDEIFTIYILYVQQSHVFQIKMKNYTNILIINLSTMLSTWYHWAFLLPGSPL